MVELKWPPIWQHGRFLNPQCTVNIQIQNRPVFKCSFLNVYWTNPVFKDGRLERMGLNGLISLAGLAVKDISPFKNPIFKIRFLLIFGKKLFPVFKFWIYRKHLKTGQICVW